ncbi:MAG: RNA polymerase sigma factor RpoD/SigA [Spirochaetaceae bacterium]|nr:RNA polymerase sigma factor RpoD/SigA [Spirochaetaceae bacterium]
MDTTPLADYLSDLKRHPLLTREEEQRYARAARDGDEMAKEKLVNSNLRFVVNISRQYQNRGIPLSDLVSEGNIGLLKAVEKFDPERGFHFTTYAVWWIRQSIMKALEAQSRSIRLPAHAASVVERIGWARSELRQRQRGEPTTDQIAHFLGLPVQRVADLLSVSRDPLSLESPAFDEDVPAELGDSVCDKAARSPEEEAMANVLKADINQVLGSLTRRESDIVQSRFGLNGRQRLTLNELGRRYRLTKERVRQIEKRALERLQMSLQARMLHGYLE